MKISSGLRLPPTASLASKGCWGWPGTGRRCPPVEDDAVGQGDLGIRVRSCLSLVALCDLSSSA
jgi:hypothetical protein